MFDNVVLLGQGGDVSKMRGGGGQAFELQARAGVEVGPWGSRVGRLDAALVPQSCVGQSASVIFCVIFRVSFRTFLLVLLALLTPLFAPLYVLAPLVAPLDVLGDLGLIVVGVVVVVGLSIFTQILLFAIGSRRDRVVCNSVGCRCHAARFIWQVCLVVVAWWLFWGAASPLLLFLPGAPFGRASSSPRSRRSFFCGRG